MVFSSGTLLEQVQAFYTLSGVSMRSSFCFWRTARRDSRWEVFARLADERGHLQCLRRGLYARAEVPTEKLRLAVRRRRWRLKDRAWSTGRTGMCVLSEEGSSRAVFRGGGACTGGSWTFSGSKRELDDRRGLPGVRLSG